MVYKTFNLNAVFLQPLKHYRLSDAVVLSDLRHAHGLVELVQFTCRRVKNPPGSLGFHRDAVFVNAASYNLSRHTVSPSDLCSALSFVKVF